MLKICCVYFGDRYSPDYVTKLYNSIKRNSTVDFEFVVISDTQYGSRLIDTRSSQHHITQFGDIATVLPYNHLADIKKHWHKLKFFAPNFANQKPGDDIIVMDIEGFEVDVIEDLFLDSHNKFYPTILFEIHKNLYSHDKDLNHILIILKNNNYYIRRISNNILCYHS